MKNITQKVLIDNIDWQSEWEDLSWDDKANFLQLNGIGFLNNDNKANVIKLYDQQRFIVEERGIDKLPLYI